MKITYYGRFVDRRLAGVLRIQRKGRYVVGGWVARPDVGWMPYADAARGLFTGDMGAEDEISRKRALAFLRKLGGKPDELDQAA